MLYSSASVDPNAKSCARKTKTAPPLTLARAERASTQDMNRTKHTKHTRHKRTTISLPPSLSHLLAGLRKPISANVMVDSVMASTCMPVPHMMDSSMGLKDGGRNTSPCTSFHPLSSCASSTVCICITQHTTTKKQHNTNTASTQHAQGLDSVPKPRSKEPGARSKD